MAHPGDPLEERARVDAPEVEPHAAHTSYGSYFRDQLMKSCKYCACEAILQNLQCLRNHPANWKPVHAKLCSVDHMVFHQDPAADHKIRTHGAGH